MTASETKIVLIVEDDPICAELCSDLLTAQGYEAIHVTDGWKAMEEVALEKRPNLILMDLQLPDISGLKASEMLKKSRAHAAIPIIAMTAFPSLWSEPACKEVGCDDYISKPFSVELFIKKVNTLIA